MKERGRLRDRQFWRKKVRGRRETEKTVEERQEISKFCKKKALTPYLPPVPLQYFYTG